MKVVCPSRWHGANRCYLLISIGSGTAVLRTETGPGGDGAGCEPQTQLPSETG